MKKAAIAFLALIVASISPVSAQSVEQKLHQATEAWTAQTGIYVPASVRQLYFGQMASQVISIVSSQDSNRIEPNRSQPSIVAQMGQPMSQTVTPTLTVPSPHAAITTEQAAGQVATPHNVGLWLERFPTIRVIVQPTPPKEFLLTINGEACPATERALYRVPAGAVTVKVWRQGSPVCERTYSASPGSVYDVACAF